ncbi:Trypsin [Popillia japonica]|uniref:Trypsin n=1 Tax=Popillia japonica TaxID=7064 RepID=A0AAW1IWK9_POPJA
MFKLVIASLLVASAFALPYPFQKVALVPMLDGRIVGGAPIAIEEVPYQISLQYFGSHICGGSTITPFYVVTAAHCTDGSSAGQLSIRAGSSNRLSGGVVVPLSAIYQHPSYNDWTIDYDISVVSLANGLTFGAAIQAVALPTLNQYVPAGSTARVSGWGTLYEGAGSLPVDLQAVQKPTVSLEECRAAYGAASVTDRMMCAGVPQGGLDACQGDSGGPLTVAGQLIGIVSWGYGCARPNYPGVYASVPALRGFITQIAGV